MEEWNPSYWIVSIPKCQAYDFQLSLAFLKSKSCLREFENLGWGDSLGKEDKGIRNC